MITRRRLSWILEGMALVLVFFVGLVVIPFALFKLVGLLVMGVTGCPGY